ncbi:MAG: hypothetical protein HKN51_16840 [Saprospiraceae bacterium]|nr:hypothetical protein [Saprospiraceae bacterium]NNK61112.1 hypothetical protein [Flavobacteriaceae bacterium]
MNLKYFYILSSVLFLLISQTAINKLYNNSNIQLLSISDQYEAGSLVELQFSTSDNAKPLLYCSNSYGSTIVTPTQENNNINYELPLTLTSKKGVVTWKLLGINTTVSGQFKIISKKEVAKMESYIGPPSIEAGGTDYTMLVVIPTDSLDNPITNKTLVSTKYQFLETQKKEDIFTQNLIAYKNIYSQKESGRMLVSSECLNFNSKEFTINIGAAIPTDFTISDERSHDYADGNQVTSFSTSVIKDKHGNVVNDGTFVNFFITNKRSNILKTSGTTINGIATAYMIHPDQEETWSVKAYIEGMAESNVLSLSYKQVINDFQVEFTNNNRNITVGPLQSFMKQMIPDGLQVKLTIYKDNVRVQTLLKTSFNGFVDFSLKPDVIKNDIYEFSITTAGLEKTFENKKVW